MDALQRILLFASWLSTEIEACDEPYAKDLLQQILGQYLDLFEDYIEPTE